ncbi:HEPN domain-containing protein [Xanthovirga aplysinae]|uniref:HEPN domain-containing protein n=1 Tax=Xanthovirga aplysinae TaxID=2529853 RepID=UPI0012BB7219|nr:HEPN domain-containing protein [Xanthovirga aplysinae]MTI31362.1 HEPN domain-containing protein [Xanthovirga aplysinae]
MTAVSIKSKSISKVAQKDIVELREKISAFKKGQIPEERFKAYRLARGVYGQRQLGVQMVRIKIPYGKLTADQLVRIADLSQEYTNGNLHATTRQNIQLHYIKLDDSPELWGKLEEVGITTRESCGNTVRNITASALAGIDPDEPFDVAPYAEAVFQYFLRNPVCQEMGRKIKMAFSSSEKDSAFTYFHDFGFIPKIRQKDGKEERGFKVVVGGGLGAQSFIAPTAYEFLPEEEIIPFIEAGLRVFDRYGERERRYKARLKYLIEEKKGIGLEKFLELVNEERKALSHQTYTVKLVEEQIPNLPEITELPEVKIADEKKYQHWLQTNVFEQKQKGYYAIRLKLLLGNLSAEKARELADIVRSYVANDIRMTVTQGIILKYVRKELLPYLFYRLNHLEFAEPGADSIADITACPGTDTCNLAVTNSTDISVELEKVIREDFEHLIADSNISIKISGCMNSCGQHMAANIGLHGSSIKYQEKVIPALQLVLGGGVDPYGKGFIAEKVIKLPSKKIPLALRFILNDYEDNSEEGEYFNTYFLRVGKRYFYNLLKPLADLEKLSASDYIDWGNTEDFIPEIGTGECAGVSFDMVSTILQDAEEKLYYAREALAENYYSGAIYHAYSTFVVAAKGLLLSKDVNCNTHKGIISDFNTHFYEGGEVTLPLDFETLVLQINKNEPEEVFAKAYLEQAEDFYSMVIHYRREQAEGREIEVADKLVLSNYYKA